MYIVLFLLGLALGSDRLLSMKKVRGAPPAGDLPTKLDSFTLPNFDCGNGQFDDGGVFIYHPVDLNGTYPIVSFLHGSGGGRFDALCYSIASLGIVVVAPMSGVCGDWTQQQLWAIKGSSMNTDLHPALQHVDFTKAGVIGHSQGGAFTMGSATHAHDYNIKAMVASHGGSPNAAPQIPADVPCMFSTGSSDPKRHKLWPACDATPGRPKVWANLAGAAHMEPIHQGFSNEFMAHFLACYTIPSKASCQKIFSDADDSLCHKYPMADCRIWWD